MLTIISTLYRFIETEKEESRATPSDYEVIMGRWVYYPKYYFMSDILASVE